MAVLNSNNWCIDSLKVMDYVPVKTTLPAGMRCAPFYGGLDALLLEQLSSSLVGLPAIQFEIAPGGITGTQQIQKLSSQEFNVWTGAMLAGQRGLEAGEVILWSADEELHLLFGHQTKLEALIPAGLNVMDEFVADVEKGFEEYRAERPTAGVYRRTVRALLLCISRGL